MTAEHDPDQRLLMDDILGPSTEGPADVELESQHLPGARAHRSAARRRFERVRQKQSLRDVVPALPEPGVSIHVVSDARFDFWTWVPVMLDWIGRTETLYASTWTLNRTTVVELAELWDAGRIGTAHFLTGLYFKRRETSVYAQLLQVLRRRGGRFRASENHAKVLLLDNADRDIYLTVEGSANLTSNPRTEQYVITNDRALYEFHRGWMEELLSR